MFHQNLKQSLKPDAHLYLEFIRKLDAGLYGNQELMQRLKSAISLLSSKACDCFMLGFKMTPVDERNAYLVMWLEFIERWKIDENRFSALQKIILEKHLWSDLSGKSLQGIFGIFEKPGYENLWPWFLGFFEEKFNNVIDRNKIEAVAADFQQFCVVCKRYKIISDLARPTVKNKLSFQLQGQDYLGRCIQALDISTDKIVQAQLLNDLPGHRQIEQAFSKKLPFVAASMVTNNEVCDPDQLGLEKTFDLNKYASKSLVLIAAVNKNQFVAATRFFDGIQKLKFEYFNTQEKILLAKCYVRLAKTQKNTVNVDAFLFWAEQIKNELGEACFAKLYETESNNQTDLNDYNRVSQLLIDLSEEYDAEKILTGFTGNIQGMVKELLIKKKELFLRKYPEKDIDTVLEDFSKKGEFVSVPFPPAEIDKLKSEYLEIQKTGLLLAEMDAQDLKNEAIKFGKELASGNHQGKIRLIAILRELMHRANGLFPYNTQILCLLAMLNIKKDTKGRIGQVRTGEGKSMIIAMLISFMTLQGRAVDVITINRNLAMRDQYIYEDYFSSLGLTSSHICFDFPDKKSFKAQILYLAREDAEFSVLRDAFFYTGLRESVIDGKLQKRPFDVVIIDEIDSLLIDEALNSARLAIPAAELTNWVYEPILNHVRTNEDVKVDAESIESVRKILQEYQDGKYKKQVETFSDKRLMVWLSSAIEANNVLILRKDYVIEPAKHRNAYGNVTKEKVLIVDAKNTGRINTESRWSKGIHEFLEVKHHLRPEDENTTLAAISHPSYFNQYKTMFGLSGTLGDERLEIEMTYQVSTFDVPPHFPNKRVKLPSRLIESHENHLNQILLNLTQATSEGRPSVALFATIAEAEEFSKFLNEKKIKHQDLTGIQQEDEDYIIGRAGQPSMITIATNIAGRGTDIVLTPESKRAGGLNLLLTFYSANLRVEDQAFGRGGRQGQPGTCSMIVYKDDKFVKELVKDDAVRRALCGDPQAFEKLDQLRYECNKKEAEFRNWLVAIEKINYQILMSFSESLTDTVSYLSNFSGSALCESLKNIKEIPINIDDTNPLIIKAHRQIKSLVARQCDGEVINWGEYLSLLSKDYITFVEQRWASFYSLLDEDRNQYAMMNVSDYEAFISNKFYEFMSIEMRQWMENPTEGLNQFLSRISGLGLSSALLTDNANNQGQFFNKWLLGILTGNKSWRNKSFRFFSSDDVTLSAWHEQVKGVNNASP